MRFDNSCNIENIGFILYMLDYEENADGRNEELKEDLESEKGTKIQRQENF